MSTRPRISFNELGQCNACVWRERKKNINWDERKSQLASILNQARSKSFDFDCLIPVSGGKDGSYISYKVKEEFGLNPLCVTVKPPLPLKIGEDNLVNFINSGYNHISISPNPTVMQRINKAGLIHKGLPYFGWLTAIEAVPTRLAHQLGIGLVIYSEDGEIEYGGSTETEQSPIYNSEYQKRVYLEGGHDEVIKSAGISAKERFFFDFPDSTDEISIIHWSYFEDWDPYRNYLVAKEKCGLQEATGTNSGTFTNFAQNDQALYALHTYIMYLKFGFGRANQDACIEIRRGAMDRSQAISLVNLYDGILPQEFIDLYLDYFEMSRSEFFEVLKSWTNKELFEVNGETVKAKFTVI
ncbi:N-acetyl sugar amidotransferase [Synechococcus sp. LTW-R]|uniref:N-acetyl sugar amidotransferase n=1 Tax=Synechococcus sp. LTW-R TaxID=2751170 RepID=UPI001C89CDFC|nr:N-acetyl sugar amidotransferase [Synechococcus sp. LTW-R]